MDKNVGQVFLALYCFLVLRENMMFSSDISILFTDLFIIYLFIYWGIHLF